MNRYKKQNFEDNKTILSSSHLNNIEDGIISIENSIFGEQSVSPNLWNISDIDTLFKTNEYRTESGNVYIDGSGNQNSTFNESYTSSDKIYINGHSGDFTLELYENKTYRWQCIPSHTFGYVVWDTPWCGITSFVGSGKNFWFYDEKDNLIANSSTTSSDGKFLMTIPEGAVYMRFMCYYAGKYFSEVKKMFLSLMVTEGAEEFSEYIKPGVNTFLPTQNYHACYCDFTDEVLSISYHYNETNDALVQIKRKGPNSIVDISGWYLLPKKYNGDVQDDLTFKTTISSWGSDCHGPFNNIIVKNNPLNDLSKDENGNSPSTFTGGNHGYKNTGASITSDPQNTPTGRSGKFIVYVDGRFLNINTNAYCDYIKIYWENFVQGRNTLKPDGSGRECLKEIHELEFYNGVFHEEVKLLPLEDLNIGLYYGMQAMGIDSVFGESIYYGGSTGKQKRLIYPNTITANANGGDYSQVICTGEQHTLFIEVDPTYDLGKRWANTEQSSIKYSPGAKLYFQLIKGLDMYAGCSYNFRTTFGLKPTTIPIYARACNENLVNTTSSSNNPKGLIVGQNNYLYYTSSEGYNLPNDILVENASYEWNPINGELKIFDITANRNEKINITIQSIQQLS